MEDIKTTENFVRRTEFKKVGDSVAIFSPNGEKQTLTILRLGSSSQEAIRLGISLRKDISIYYLDRDLSFMDAGIGHGGSHIVMFPSSSDQNLRHELIHAVELSHNPTQELLDFYQRVKMSISENSFSDTDGVTYNFSKDIHEFIVDGYNNAWFISALKKEGLYEEFLKVTEYLQILR